MTSFSIAEQKGEKKMSEEIMNQAKEDIKKKWPKNAEAVLDACNKAEKFQGAGSEFMDQCIACGGNLVGMLISGIRKLWPEVYSALPDSIGDDGFESFYLTCRVLLLCGVDLAS